MPTFALDKQKRKVAGVIDRGGLEIRCTACPYRGFESLTFRKDIYGHAVVCGVEYFRGASTRENAFDLFNN